MMSMYLFSFVSIYFACARVLTIVILTWLRMILIPDNISSHFFFRFFCFGFFCLSLLMECNVTVLFAIFRHTGGMMTYLILRSRHVQVYVQCICRRLDQRNH
ncbi:hypothetical protein BJ165DRAFT_429405 [Panaeolus papilionaceus]|nr:hypothetical protein BJ165DRAFT_429405 [Panaeolus papilionaceus]